MDTEAEAMDDDLPTWAARLRARALAAPLRPRAGLHASGDPVPFGSLEPALAQALVEAGLPLRRVDDRWEVGTPLDAALERIARWLSEHVLGNRWRGELLPVRDDAGRELGAIERAVVRPLGLATHAVHLVGETADGRVWVQQRALDKAVDPGLWDTLMGGLMAAGETLATTLERETWEEAGLRLAQLDRLAGFGRLTARRPVADGYMVEHIHCYEARVPDGVSPLNQDGEVLRFEAVDPETLEQRLRADAFTLEAAMVLLRRQEHHRGRSAQ
ncbi:MAG: NUDIX domain-containing protein [Burkholderiaceae bacterium]